MDAAAGDTTVTAIFDDLPTLTVALAAASTGTGTVNITPPNVVCTPVTGSPPAACIQDQAVDTAVVLTAAADAGSVFNGWARGQLKNRSPFL